MSMAVMAAAAKNASVEMAKASTSQKNHALELLSKSLQSERSAILEANRHDITLAKKNGLSGPMLSRLNLDGALEGIIHDLQAVMSLQDPVGEILEKRTRGSLTIVKQRTPIGVLGVIYESRPNVTVDVAALAIKSGNCALLRGGSEALHSNMILTSLISAALQGAGLPTAAIQLVTDIDRSNVLKLLHLHHYIDLIIPRGGAELHRFCRENSSIPVITGGIGICHIFVDATALQDKALEVIENAKIQHPTACNALDTLLIHQAIGEAFIPKVLSLLAAKGVTFRLDEKSMAIATMSGFSGDAIQEARDPDWDIEWLGLTLGIKVVANIAEAIAHINKHSMGHSDAILTENQDNAALFVSQVDSAAVYVNASTRFSDGAQLGLGAEVAISTQKLHARGPMGLCELTSYKWVIHGDYTVRS